MFILRFFFSLIIDFFRASFLIFFGFLVINHSSSDINELHKRSAAVEQKAKELWTLANDAGFQARVQLFASEITEEIGKRIESLEIAQTPSENPSKDA